jgi:hypothetical protein
MSSYSKPNQMKKPEPRKIERLDYNECAKYIGEKLGYDLRDTLGKFKRQPYDDSIEYRDFWHLIIDRCDIHNGCEFWMPEEDSAEEDWQVPILKAFWEEFGEGPYWVSW